MKPFIRTWKSAATVQRWATTGPKRIRKKYLHALTLCGIVNPRHGGPILAQLGEEYGKVGTLKLCFGGWPAHLWVGPLDVWVEDITLARRIIQRAGDLDLTTIQPRDTEMSNEACCPRATRRRCWTCKTHIRHHGQCEPCRIRWEAETRRIEETEDKLYYLNRMIVQARLRDARRSV